MKTITAPANDQSLRRSMVAFLMQRAADIGVSPAVKYSALSLLADRFYPSLSLSSQKSPNWLLNPIGESNLQLFALISLWIAAKFHESPPLPLKTLKSMADNHISDQHFTKRDFLEAEKLFLQCLNFEIGAMSSSPMALLEELLFKLKAVARAGEMVSFEACLDIMDLVYESDEISRLFVESPVVVVAGILVSSFVITVPKQSWEFPLLSWVNFVSGCSESDVVWIVEAILHHILHRHGNHTDVGKCHLERLERKK